jgi:hypothetical protein
MLSSTIGDDQLDTCRQAGAQGVQPLFYCRHRVQRIVAVAHYHDAADGFAFAIQIGDAAPCLGTNLNVRHLRQAQRVTLRILTDSHLAQIGDRLYIAFGANHVFSARHFDHCAAAGLIRRAYCFCDVIKIQVVGGHFIRVKFDLKLLGRAAHSRDFGYTRHALQFVFQEEILQCTQLVVVDFSAAVHQCVLKYPADARCIRPQCGGGAGGQMRHRL